MNAEASASGSEGEGLRLGPSAGPLDAAATPEERWKGLLEENPGRAVFCYVLYTFGQHNRPYLENARLASDGLRMLLKGRTKPMSHSDTLRAYWRPSRYVKG